MGHQRGRGRPEAGVEHAWVVGVPPLVTTMDVSSVRADGALPATLAPTQRGSTLMYYG